MFIFILTRVKSLVPGFVTIKIINFNIFTFAFYPTYTTLPSLEKHFCHSFLSIYLLSNQMNNFEPFPLYLKNILHLTVSSQTFLPPLPFPISITVTTCTIQFPIDAVSINHEHNPTWVCSSNTSCQHICACFPHPPMFPRFICIKPWETSSHFTIDSALRQGPSGSSHSEFIYDSNQNWRDYAVLVLSCFKLFYSTKNNSRGILLAWLCKQITISICVQQCTLATTTAPAMQCQYSGDMHELNKPWRFSDQFP